MKWGRKWWWLIAGILGIGLTIGWKVERCEVQAYQCRADYAAQAQSERLSGIISVNQQAAEQQAIATACEPTGYFCRLFSATNLPTMLLVFIGIGAVCAALRTLWAIEKQTEAMERSVALQSVQWIAFREWSSALLTPYQLNVSVEIANDTSFPLTLREATFRVGSKEKVSDEDITIVPKGTHKLSFIHSVGEEEREAYTNHITNFGVRGALRFIGVDGKTLRSQPFGGLIKASHVYGTSFTSESAYEQSAKEHYGKKSANQDTTDL
jgi:hypothetical protein